MRVCQFRHSCVHDIFYTLFDDLSTIFLVKVIKWFIIRLLKRAIRKKSYEKGKFIMKRIKEFVKQEVVLVAAFVLAVLSCFFVKPDKEYIGYLDIRVLVLLFCLMAVMEGFKQLGIFEMLARKLLGKTDNSRSLCMVLVFLCFFSSMLITNDVALITFVPFTILILTMAGRQDKMIVIIVLQTVAANLGSMLTPVGNPQNLYLYTVSKMGFGEFVKEMLPLTVVSFVLLFVCCMLQKKEPVTLPEQGMQIMGEGKRKIQLVTDCVLFLLSLLCVLRILPYPVLFGITLAGLLIMQREILKKVDYCLLLTFVSFFIFIGNMGRIPYVCELLEGLLQGRELLTAFFCSQVISNVPAAVLLSGFTENYTALLQGVNVGGLGTLIASLASLISYKFYAASEGSRKGRYFCIFTAINVVFAVILLTFAMVLR